MERFAIKIDKKLKANLYKICRLCGIDNPDMVPIILDKQDDKNENACIDVEAEMEMQQKISLLIGLSITKDDKMPQTMCCLCVDKINDFYEFREMCYATNSQTRKLLGLKNVKKTSLDIKPKVEVKEESIVPTSTFTGAAASTKNVNRKRKSDESTLKEETSETPAVVSKKKLRFSVPLEPAVKEEVPVPTKKKLRFSAICEEPTPPAVSISKKSKNIAIEDTKLKKEPSPPVPAPPPAVSNKKLRLAAPSLKESVTKKSKQKVAKSSEQKESDVKEEIKEEVKEEAAPMAAPIPPVLKLKFGCNICKERFPAKVNLETHNRSTHIPKIERFVCTACNEVLTKSFDIKNHQLWHKLSKTPYVCGCCGDSILNTYAFSRHLREHTFETPPALLVLDRECPLCHTTYATNFLYNIHVCAVKTKRCAGCNRLQRNDAEYLKHSAQCAKVYLNYSKHIMPSVEALEDAVRIKNENDVEAAAEEMARISGVSLDMAPVVQLTRLSSPLIMAASQCASMAGLDDATSSSSKKSGKKGVSKKDFKRVDELLKSTLDALVSIKHEPEVHVDQETPCVGERSDNEDRHDADDQTCALDDIHHNNDSDNESADMNASAKVVNTTENSATTDSCHEQIKIKQEVDEASEENPNKTGGSLKLKIKKEHGQLNSSIIEQQKTSEKRAEKRKKKKKHKDKEKEKQKAKDVLDEQVSQVSQDSNTNNNNSELTIETTRIRIKAEPQDGAEEEVSEKSMGSVLQIRPQPEATIMTSIPMMQFQIACVSSGVEFNNAVVETHQTIPSANRADETEDIKPNREELDRMLKISHVSSGIAMETEESEAQYMDHDGNNDKGNGDDEETDHHEESNVDDNYRDDNESAEQENIQAGYPDNEQETEDKTENDGGKSFEDTEIDNKEIIAKKIKKLLLQSKPKLTLKPKDKTLNTVTKSRNKACKSTAKPSNMPILQISAVQSGVTLESSTPILSEFTPIFIKPEPKNRGYCDEQPADAVSSSQPQNEAVETQDDTEELPQTHSVDEQNYISSIDFNNITIKQEKDIEINDVQITPKSIKSFRKLNGIKKKRKQVVRSPCVKDKTLQGAEKMTNKVADDEEDGTNEEDEDENLDEEIDDEEEEGEEEDEEEEEELEEEDEEEDEDIDEEEDEEREYRELEYPPELVEKNEELKSEQYNAKDNENNTTANEYIDSSVAHNVDDIPNDLQSNIGFVIASVCSQATSEIPEVSSLKSSDENNHRKVLENHDNNILTPENIRDTNDVNIAPNSQQDNKTLELSSSLDDNNAEILSYQTKKEEHTTDCLSAAVSSCNNDLSNASPHAEIPNSDTDLRITVTCNENYEDSAHTIPPTLSAQILQENIQPCDISLQIDQTVGARQDGQKSENLEFSGEQNIIDSALESTQEKQNYAEQLLDTQHLQEIKLHQEVNISNALENSQSEIQHSNEGAKIEGEPRLDSTEQQQLNISQDTAEQPQELQSGIHALLENLPNIQNFEIQSQTSQHHQSMFEISSVRTTVLDVNSELKINPSSNYDDHQISKANQNDTATIEGVIHQPKDVNLEAQPITENFDTESVNDDENGEDDNEDMNENILEENDNNNDESALGDNLEERQNYQNQEVLSQIRPTAIALHPYLEDISSSSNSLLSNSLSQTPPPPLLPLASAVGTDEFYMQSQEQQRPLNMEETDNILNESNDVLNRRCVEVAETSAASGSQSSMQPHLGQQLPPRMPTFNFDNINEIAENNNNANIEREQLQDGQHHQN